MGQLGGVALRFDFGAGLSVLRFDGNGLRCALHVDCAPQSGLRGLRGGLRALGQRTAQSGRVHGSIRLRNYGADLGQAGIV